MARANLRYVHASTCSGLGALGEHVEHVEAEERAGKTMAALKRRGTQPLSETSLDIGEHAFDRVFDAYLPVSTLTSR